MMRYTPLFVQRNTWKVMWCGITREWNLIPGLQQCQGVHLHLHSTLHIHQLIHGCLHILGSAYFYTASQKALNKHLTSGCVLRLRPPTHWTQFALCSSAFVCVCLCLSACVCVRLCTSLPPIFWQSLSWVKCKLLTQDSNHCTPKTRLLSKTSKNQGRPTGWLVGLWKRLIECQLHFWILKSYQHGTRIDRKRDSRPKHITRMWNAAEEFCMHLHLSAYLHLCLRACICVHVRLHVCICAQKIKRPDASRRKTISASRRVFCSKTFRMYYSK